nr:MAG TPA: hypothetical protein [Bacteriophage sp.]
MLVPFDHVQSHTGFHTGALGLSIGRFCRAYDHIKSTRIDGCRICDRSHDATGIDQISRTGPGQSLYFFLTGFSTVEKINSLFRVKSAKIEQKFPKFSISYLV